MIRSLLLGAVAAFQVENIILDKQLGERSFNDRYVQEFIEFDQGLLYETLEISRTANHFEIHGRF